MVFTGWQSPGYSNPNLLKNWDFRQPVNQHGQMEYTTGNLEIYTIDMWKIGWNGKLTVKDGYIATAGPDACYIRTVFEDGYIKNRLYTFSLADDTNAVYSAIIKRDVTDIPVGKHLLSVSSSQLIIKNAGNIQAVKLEVGTVSTLALDLMQPPNYAEQLRLCQRYLQVIDYNRGNYKAGFGIVGDATSIVDGFIPLNVPMRLSTPTFSSTDGSKWSIICAGKSITPTVVEPWFASESILGLRFKGTFPSTLEPFTFSYNSADKFFISAEL